MPKQSIADVKTVNAIMRRRERKQMIVMHENKDDTQLAIDDAILFGDGGKPILTKRDWDAEIDDDDDYSDETENC